MHRVSGFVARNQISKEYRQRDSISNEKFITTKPLSKV